ncbi:hypothetical protein BSKO_03198 [Bryopsis sp. KO-2023]|nr:hypothetical protein BSKO_03198 [Bryopsis sp. KO-2023]
MRDNDPRLFSVWGKFGRLWPARPSASNDGFVATLTPAKPGVIQRKKAPLGGIAFRDVAVNPKEDLLATVDNRGNVVLFHLATNRYARIGQPGPAGTCVEFSSRNKGLLFSGHADGSIRCYNATTRAQIGVLRGHRTSVKFLAFKSSADEMVSTSVDCVVIWSTKTLKRIRTLGSGHKEGGFFQARYLRGGSSGERLITSGRDGLFRIWDSKTLLSVGRAAIRNEMKTSRTSTETSLFCLSPNGKWLVAAGNHGGLFVCELASCGFTHGLKFTDRQGVKSVQGVSFLPDSETVAVLAQDGVVHFVNVHKGSIEYRVSPGAQGKVCNKMALDVRGNNLALVSDTGQVLMYDLAKARSKGSQNLTPGKIEVKRFETPEQMEDFLMATQRVDIADGTVTENTTSENDLGSSGERLQENGSSCSPALRTHRTGGGKAKKTNTMDPSQLRVARLDAMGQKVNKNRLQGLLEAFGEYPERYRLLVWEFLLEIPHNGPAFEVLANRGLHPAFQQMGKSFPLLSKVLLGRLSRILSKLAHWCPVLGEATFLPSFVFPFVKLFGSHEETCFEILVTILLNWGSAWFQTFPRPPTALLGEFENLVSYHDPPLFEALSGFQGGVGRVGWSLMSSLLSAVVSKPDWLKIMDHMVSNDPPFLHFLVLSHLVYFRQSLLDFEMEEDIESFLNSPRPSNINKIIRHAYALNSSTPEQLAPAGKKLEPLGAGDVYKELTVYPHAAVGWVSQERQRIQAEEEALVRRRWLVQELEARTRRLENVAGKGWKDSVQARQLGELEAQKQKAALRSQEQEVLAEKARLEDRVKQEQLKQIAIMEEAYQSGLENMQIEMNRQSQLEQQDIATKKKALEFDLKSALENEKIKALTFQAEQRLFGLEQEKLKSEAKQRMESETSTQLAVIEAQQKKQLEQWQAEDQETEIRRKHQAAARFEMAATAEENASRLALEEAVRKTEIDQETRLQALTNERRIQQAAMEEADRMQRLLEEERNRDRIFNVQDRALLKAQGEDDRAWFEREQAKTESALLAKKTAREEEKIDRNMELLERERRARLQQGEAELIARRRKMERALLLKEQDAKRILDEVEAERRREKLADAEMRLKQEEIEARVKHASQVSQLQELVESNERKIIEKENRGLQETELQGEAEMYKRHSDIMSQLALERERQILELDTAWRKQVRIEETARLERVRLEAQAKQLNIENELLNAEETAANEVAALQQKNELTKHNLASDEGPSGVQPESQPDMKTSESGEKKDLSDVLFSSGDSSIFNQLLAQVELASDGSEGSDGEKDAVQSQGVLGGWSPGIGNASRQGKHQQASSSIASGDLDCPEFAVEALSMRKWAQSNSQKDADLGSRSREFPGENFGMTFGGNQMPDFAVNESQDGTPINRAPLLAEGTVVDSSSPNKSKNTGSESEAPFDHQFFGDFGASTSHRQHYGGVAAPADSADRTSSITFLKEKDGDVSTPDSSQITSKVPSWLLPAVAEEEADEGPTDQDSAGGNDLEEMNDTRSRISALLDGILGSGATSQRSDSQHQGKNSLGEMSMKETGKVGGGSQGLDFPQSSSEGGSGGFFGIDRAGPSTSTAIEKMRSSIFDGSMSPIKSGSSPVPPPRVPRSRSPPITEIQPASPEESPRSSHGYDFSSSGKSQKNSSIFGAHRFFPATRLDGEEEIENAFGGFQSLRDSDTVIESISNAVSPPDLDGFINKSKGKTRTDSSFSKSTGVDGQSVRHSNVWVRRELKWDGTDSEGNSSQARDHGVPTGEGTVRKKHSNLMTAMNSLQATFSHLGGDVSSGDDSH